MSFIPEDRLGMGLAPNFSITDNMMLKTFKDVKKFTVKKPEEIEEETTENQSKFDKVWKFIKVAAKKTWYVLRKIWCAILTAICFPFVDRKKARKEARELIDKLAVVTPSTETPIRRLSGGNVQKVLVGREIGSNPNVIVTAYPVRGLDINSSYVIYDILNEQKQKGTGILFIGEDLDVMLALCDKIMVLCHGKNMGIVHASKVTKEELGLMMTGAVDLTEQKEYGKAKDSQLTEEEWAEEQIKAEEQAKEDFYSN